MSQKTLNLLLAVAGLAVVVAFAALGYDVYRAARTGPRWRRRLVAAGLALLAMLGIPACEGTRAGDPPAPTAGPARSLADAPEWKRLTAVWREAEEVASGKRGAYPFDRKGKEKLLARLKQAEADVAALQAAGLVTAPEAGLLTADLARLTRGVGRKRPTELRMATCYKPIMVIPARDSLGRLTARLPLLQQLAEGGKLHADVVRKALVSVEADLAVLGQEPMLQRLTGAERAKAAEVRQAAAAEVAKLKAALKGGNGDGGHPSLETSADWKAITDAWAAAMPLATSRKSTTAQRKAADAKLEAAKAAAKRLADAGLLAPQEADLLVGEAANIRTDIYRDPPTDCKVTCYDMAYIPPARQSTQRLAKRLPLVEKLVAGGKVREAACAKIVAAIEADLAVLGDAKQLKALQGKQRDQAEKARDQAADALARLKNKLGS